MPARGEAGRFQKNQPLVFGPRLASERSVAAARNVWASERSAQKIIGHQKARSRERVSEAAWVRRRGQESRGVNGARSLLDQPRADQGVGVPSTTGQGVTEISLQASAAWAGERVRSYKRVSGNGEKKSPSAAGCDRWSRGPPVNELTCNVSVTVTSAIPYYYNRIVTNCENVRKWESLSGPYRASQG